MGVQIYRASRLGPVLLPEEGEDEMLDFGDIGVVYDSPAAASANTTALQGFLSSRLGAEGTQIACTGSRLSPTYNERRQPGIAYFDLSGGPLTYYPTSTDAGHIAIVGMAGSKMVGVNAATATTPVLDMGRANGGIQKFQISNLEIQNPLGSGLRFSTQVGHTGPGAMTMLSDVMVRNCGTSLPGGSIPTIDFDGWSDLDTAIYGIYMDEADGGHLYGFSINNVQGHGIIAKRWHEGACVGNVRECMGSGLKGEQVNSVSLGFRAESNGGFGFHVRDTGNSTHTSNANKRGEDGAPNAWDVWTEANNGRGITDTDRRSTGFRYRQNKIDSSSRITLGGHIGWSYNKMAVEEPARRSCRFVQEDFIDPSVDGIGAVLEYDMNNDGVQLADGTQDNWGAAWIDPGVRPSVATAGSTGAGDLRAIITVPAQAYVSASTSAWWLPIPPGVTIADSAAGETWMWAMELQCDQPGVDYCESREALPVASRMPSYLGSMSIRPFTGASRTFALWSTAKRKFSGRAPVDYAATGVGLTMYVWFDGMEDTGGSGVQYPDSDIQLTIWDLKLYRIKP